MRADVHASGDIPTCGPEESIGEIRKRLEGTGWDVCVVVNSERVVMGLLGESELGGSEDETAEQAMRPGPTTFRPHVNVAALAHHMKEHDLHVALITTSDGRLLGALKQDRALEVAHGEHDHDHHREDRAK